MAVGGYFANTFRLVRTSRLGGSLSHMVENSINRLARVLYSPIGYKNADNSSKSATIRISHINKQITLRQSLWTRPPLEELRQQWECHFRCRDIQKYHCNEHFPWFVAEFLLY